MLKISLISLTIMDLENILKLNLFSDIYVSTDSKNSRYRIKFGAKVLFKTKSAIRMS